MKLIENENEQGYIYALQSDNCECIKVGRTNSTPGKRLAQINASKNYGPLGPWRQITSIKVVDTSTVEAALHQGLRSCRSLNHPGCRELFSTTADAIRHRFAAVNLSYRPDAVEIDKLNVDQSFLRYLIRLFETTGLEHFMDQQEAWTFSLYPSTAGGRYFTLNIGKHEVAYSSPIYDEAGAKVGIRHMIYADILVRRDRTFKKYLRTLGGRIPLFNYYSSALQNGQSIFFEGSFDDVVGIFDQPTLRRAVTAYWFDALLGLRDRGSRSFFARSHNHNAVTAIMDYLRKNQKFEQRKVHKYKSADVE